MGRSFLLKHSYYDLHGKSIGVYINILLTAGKEGYRKVDSSKCRGRIIPWPEKAQKGWNLEY